MALLCALNELKYELGLTLGVAHYNHRLRPSADGDQEFVEDVARRLNVPCYSARSRSLHQKSKGSLEERARKERLHFFKKITEKHDFNSVALAHHRDDLAETVLMRIIRGSGLQGLRAMRAESVIDGLRVKRPFLMIARPSIIEYLNARRVTYREDPSNQDTNFTRNKIRHELMPLLAGEYNANINESLVNIGLQAQEDFEYLSVQCQKAFKRISHVSSSGKKVSIDVVAYSRLPVTIRKMIIRRCYEHLKGDTNRLTSSHVQQVLEMNLLDSVAPRINLPAGVVVKRQNQKLHFSRTNST